MTAAEILALPAQVYPRLLKASDSGLYYAISAGETGAQAAALASGTFTPVPAIIPDADDRSLGLTDAGDYIRFTNVTGTLLTVPTNGAVAFPISTQIYFRRAAGAGPITLSNAGVTVNNSAKAATIAEHGNFALIKIDTDEWDLI